MTAPTSLPAVLLDRFAASPGKPAYEVRDGAGWRTWTWREVETVVRELSAGLVARGVQPGQTVAILAGTRLEWILADFAILCAGAATTTIYPSSTADEASYILEDAGCTALFVERQAQTGGVDLPDVVVAMEDDSWDALRAAGRDWLDEHGADAWEAIGRAAQPDDLATLIYTSGTTGRPKGVRLVHDCWLAQAEALSRTIEQHRQPDDKLYVWLPLAHAYGKVLQLAGVQYDVPTAVDGDIDRLQDSMEATRPTYVPAVPRVFEKMYAKIRGRVVARGERVAKVFDWAAKVARDVARLEAAGARVPWVLWVQHGVADRLVYRKIRQAFGGRIRAFFSGSAPLAPELAHFFEGVGMPILEGYGLTECAAVATANAPDDKRLGSVGKAGQGMEVRISDDGEVLLRGRAVMRGYHNRDDATAEAFEAGWFRTGDLGRIDGDGFVYITGRIKELIITSGGKNIAPVPIESAVKARCPLLQELVMLGDGRKFCAAIATLDPEGVQAWCALQGRSIETPAPEDLGRWAADPAVNTAIREAIDAVNATLPSYATIKGFVVLDRELSIEGGELTPSQKVRRTVIAERYGERLDALYADARS
jgi:long-chain acyl-CoA synthetase